MQTLDFDVVIAGGGPVGMTLALALSQGGFQVALLESWAASAPAPVAADAPYDQRVFALTRASEHIFRHLGVWDSLLAQRLGVFRQIQVWENQGVIDFDSASLGEAALGYIVELGVLRAALGAALAQRQVSWFNPAQLQAYTAMPQGLSLQLDSGIELHTRLLVGADGHDSQVRVLAGIPSAHHEYGHHALVAVVKTALPHQHTARQRFLPSGPLAFLPLADPHHCSIVWSAPPAMTDRLLGLSQTDFHHTLAQTFENKLGPVLWSGPRAAFPLVRRHAQQYSQARIVLVGDAAHTIHPLAGQGMNLGLLDAAALAEVLLEGRQQGRDLGDPLLLRRYERWRRSETLSMMGLMDAFRHLFGNRFPPLRGLRNLGLHFTNLAPPLKHLIMRQAMGLSGDLPRLARPGEESWLEQR